ncbi:MAG: hypothetical protein NVS2B7_07220 [Herpetosiphon sp.]
MLETEGQIIQRYVRPGKVKLVYRHLLQLGEGSFKAAEASECAGAQGRFWPTRRLLYSQNGLVTADIASNAGLDGDQFKQCLAAHTFSAAVKADDANAQAQHISGRPYFLIEGTRIVGSQTFATFQAAIDSKLK